jgi:hypothetical protein
LTKSRKFSTPDIFSYDPSDNSSDSELELDGDDYDNDSNDDDDDDDDSDDDLLFDDEEQHPPEYYQAEADNLVVSCLRQK